MGSLSRFVPTELKTVTAITDWWKARGDAEPVRGYMGASIIGRPCDRYLWFTFRGCVKASFDGRMYRLFDRGQREEARFVEELRGIGCTVRDREENGEQIAVHALGGHFSGHMDGVAMGVPDAPKTWHLLEFKTHNTKSFEKLQQVGVKAAKPEHYAQMQVYMGLGKLDRALYLAVCKDTDEIYGERLDFSSGEFKAIMKRAERIIVSVNPPERIANRQDDFRCKFCDAYDLCWGLGKSALPIPAKTCRTCVHATPITDNVEDEFTHAQRWTCARQKRDITRSEQKDACSMHLLIPGLLTFCVVEDAGDTWIEFKNGTDGAIWRHGSEAGQWSTEELMKTPGPLVGRKELTAVKTTFGGLITGTETLTLVDRYPPADSRLLWDGPIDGVESAVTTLGLTAAFNTEPIAEQHDVEVDAYEYCAKYLLVMYKADELAAIWQGVE